jgi:hypothetical protein
MRVLPLIVACASSSALLGACGDDDPSAAQHDAAQHDAVRHDAAVRAQAEDCSDGDSACACDQLCLRIERAGCADDPPRDECIATCLVEPDSCQREAMAELTCAAAQPQSHYSCDLGQYLIAGCDDELDAYTSCQFGP